MTPRRINRDRLGRWSLRLDAGYCTVLGVALVCSSGWITHGLPLPPPLIVVIGVAVVIWAAGIVWMLKRLSLSLALRVVMVANTVAAIAVGLVSVAAATPLVVIAVLAVAIDIALFAVSQAVALRPSPQLP
ncbi:hypothetical protein EII34_09600 [Arachnia propionica]|uniref:Uncharacterized protein n=1 Tax=Arachnia propionica TaxID=1750 RepID=A0A3P1T4W7_9ACTN|nr:hypothetical protein [Arachnia propionica]RRD04552.1 hypothetical protein EII34_09600 [Arachnia propionica]